MRVAAPLAPSVAGDVGQFIWGPNTAENWIHRIRPAYIEGTDARMSSPGAVVKPGVINAASLREETRVNIATDGTGAARLSVSTSSSALWGYASDRYEMKRERRVGPICLERDQSTLIQGLDMAGGVVADL